jgi:hypothetical protein
VEGSVSIKALLRSWWPGRVDDATTPASAAGRELEELAREMERHRSAIAAIREQVQLSGQPVAGYEQARIDEHIRKIDELNRRYAQLAATAARK